MFSKLKSILFLALIVGLVGACDISETGTQNSTKPQFTSTDDISDRITYINSSSKSKAGPAGGSTVQDIPDYEAVAQVSSPVVKGSVTRASHLSLDQNSGLLTVGYKLAGEPYGGGIDIIQLADNIDNTDNSDIVENFQNFSSQNFDVQEVRLSVDKGAVYVAGALEEPKEDSPSPSRILKLSLDNNGEIAEQRSEILSGNVAKSLVLGEGQNSDQVFVISDKNMLYRFGEDLGPAQATLSAGDDVEFRSVEVRNNNNKVFVLDRNGIVHITTADPLNGFYNTTDLIPDSEIEGLENSLSIARLQIFDRQHGSDIFIAALNELGFSILNESGFGLWNSQESQNSEFYVSVAFLESSSSYGTDFLLAARKDGIIDFYEIPNGWNLPNDELTKAGSIDLSQVAGLDLSGAQVNQILATENYLYVANSTDGLVILRLNKSKSGDGGEAPDAPNGAKGISFAAFCTTQGNYDADDISITDIKEKEEGEPVSIAWESDTELSTVVLKAGPSMWNYDGGSSGGAASGAGTSVGNDQSPPSPCPSGEDLVVKKEVDGNGEFKNEGQENDDNDDNDGDQWWWGD